MSKTIDERVVSMQFDNRNFESNVKTTMSTLEKLKARLNLSGASKGLESINTAATKCNLSPISNSIDTVSVKFSKLQAAAAHALGDIAIRAYRTGESVVKSLTITPITTGFNEYELKMNSIQTIMASTGESLETVNQYLNELNKYSDETIYSFSDMTQNIGKFTNAGVKLEDAVTAIKGIANEAALSGANANEAARAMYNFSQALSTGYVQRIDWKSIELANMATIDFKEQLLEQAVAMGTVTKNAEGMYKALGDDKFYNTSQMFIEALDEQWLTSDVLIRTLQNYADVETDIGKRATKAATEVKTFSHMMDTLKESAQSGWAQTWEIIFGDFEEGKTLWTSLNDVIGGFISKTSELRNTKLGGVLDSNWEKLADKIGEAGIPIEEFQKALIETGKTHGKVTDKMIDEEGGFVKSLKKGWATVDLVVETLEKFTGVTGEASKATEKITDKVEYFQKAFDNVWGGNFGNGAARVKALTEAGYDYATVQSLVNKHAAGYKLTAEDLVDVVANLSEEQLKNIGLTEEEATALQELQRQAKETGTPIRELIEDLSKPTGRELIIESFVTIFEKLKPVIEGLKQTWDDVFGDFPTFGEVLSTLIDKFADFANELVINEDKIKSITKTFEGLLTVTKMLALMSGGAFGFLFKTFNMVANELDVDIWNVTETVAEVIIWFYKWITTNNVLYDSVVKIGTAVVDFVISTINSIRAWIDTILQLEHISVILGNLTDSFAILLTNIGNWLSGLLPMMTNFINTLFEMDSITLDGVLSALGTLFSDIFDKIRDLLFVLYKPFVLLTDLVIAFFAELGNGSGTTEEFYENFNKIKNVVYTVINPIRKAINTLLDWGKAFSAWIVSLKDVEDIPSAIGNAIGRVLGSIVKYIATSIYEFGKSLYDGMTGAGSDGIAGLILGLLKGIPDVLGAIVKVAWSLIEGFCAALGIHSPSRVMMGLGVFIIMGLIMGLKQAFPEVWSSIVSFGSGIVAAFNDTFGPLIDFLKGIDFGKIISVGLIGGLLFFIKKMAAMGDRVGESLATMLESISGVFKGVAGIIGGVKSAITNVSDAIVKNIQADAFKKRAEAIKSLAIGLAILAGALIALALVNHYGVDLWSAVGAIAALAGVLAGFTLVIALINKFIGSVSLKFAGVAVGMVGLAASMAILAVAAKKFAEVPVDRFWDVIPAMTALMFTMMGMTTIFGRYVDADVAGNIKKLGGVFIKLGAAMLIMAYVVKIAGSIPEPAMRQGWVAIVGFGTILGGLMWVSKFAGSDIKSIGNTILKIGIVFVLMSKVVKAMGKLKPEQLDQGITALAGIGGILLAMVGMMEVLNFISSSLGGGDTSKIGSTLLKIAGSIILITAAALMLAFIPFDNLMNAGAALAVMTFMIMALITTLNRIDAGNLKGIGSTVLMVAASLTVLAVAAKIFSSIPWPQLMIAGVAIGVLGAAIGYFIKFLSTIETKKLSGVGVTLLLVSGAIAILATMATIIGLIDLGILAKGIAAIAMLGVMTALIIKATENSKDAKSTLIGMTIALVALAAAIAALSFIPADSLNAATTALMGVMAALAVVMRMTEYAKIDMKSIVTIAGIIAILGGLLYLLGQLNPGNAVAAGAALSAAMLSFAGAMAIINKFGKASSGAKTYDHTLKTIGVLAAVALALSVAIAIIGQLEPSNAFAAGGALSVALIALSGAMVLITKFGSAGSNAAKLNNTLKTLGVLAAVALALSVAIAIIGQLDWDRALAAAGALSLTLIALAGSMAIMGKFGAGGSVATIIAMSVALVAIGAAMLMIAQIPAGQLLGVFGALAGSLAVLTIALIALAAGFTTFAPGAALMTGVLLALSVSLLAIGAAMLMIAQIPSDQLWSVFGVLAASLAVLTIAVVAMAAAFTFFAPGAALVVGILLAISVVAVAVGVAAVLFAGALDIVGAALPAVATGLDQISVSLVTFCNAIKNGVIAVAEGFASFVTIIGESSDSAWGFIGVCTALLVGIVLLTAASAVFVVGATLMTTALVILSVGLVVVSAAVVIFAGALVIGAAAVYLMADAIAYLGQCISGGLAEGIESGKGLVSTAVSGLANSVIGTICSALGIHSPSLVMQLLGQYTGQGFAMGISDSEGEVSTAATDLAKVAEEGLGGAGAEGGAEFNLEALENMDIESLMSGSGIDTSSLTGVFDTAGKEGGSAFNTSALENMDFESILSGSGMDMSALTGAFGDLGIESGTAFSTGASENASMKPTLDAMLEEVSGTKPRFNEAGVSVLKAFGEGLTAAGSSVTTKLASSVQSMATGLKNKKNSFYNAGKYLVAGFANGITVNTFMAQAAASAMARAAYMSAKKALDINSPSKIFRALGTSVPEGFAMGIGMLGGMVRDSVETMAGTAIDGTRDVISRIADAVNTDIDSQPTIRPVLDLSDVEAGAGAIGGMLSANSIGLSAVGSISTMMNRRSQNGGNGDVVSAIDKLRKDLGNVGNTSYTINGITYDRGSELDDAFRTIVRYATIEGRV